MSFVLLDTSIVSLLHPRRRESDLLEIDAAHMAKQTLTLSFQSVAELWRWAESREWGDEARHGIDVSSSNSWSFRTTTRWRKHGHAQCMPARGKVADSRQGTAGLRRLPFTERFPLTHDRDFLSLSIPGLQVISYLESE